MISSASLVANCLLLSVGLIAGREVVEQPRVHLHERLQHVVDEGHDRLVPVLLTDSGGEEGRRGGSEIVQMWSSSIAIGGVWLKDDRDDSILDGLLQCFC